MYPPSRRALAVRPCRSLLGSAALAVALSALSGCDRPDLVGTWVGREERGAEEVYSFLPGGTGWYSVAGNRQPLTYHLRAGYPNLIEVVIGDSGRAELRRGLLQVSWDGRMRLQLGPPGGPPPEQLSSQALVLSQPATR